MEQLRNALEVLKKYHFWILCGLIVLITFGTWYWATADRATAFAARKTAIEGKINSIKSIGCKTDHPSEPYIKAILVRENGNLADVPEEVAKIAIIKSAADSLSSKVSSAAQRLFDDQRSINRLPLVFPNNAGDQRRFEADFWKVWNHRIEDIERPPEGANHDQYELDKTFRDAYRNRIKDIFPKLFDMVDRRMVADNTGALMTGERMPPGRGNMGGGQILDSTKQYKGTVDWPGADELMKRFEIWPSDLPSTLQVMLAQEDVWVYEALLRVIRNTNDFRTEKDKSYKAPPSHKLARIKEIQGLEIANDAAQSWTSSENSVINLGDSGGAAAATATATPTDQRGGTMGPVPGGMMGFGGGSARYLQQGPTMAGTAPGAAAAAPVAAPSALADRYVDNNGKPLSDPTQQPNQEFRMMPINMRVIMEQKDIPRLLVECANSSMRIDVRAVRILAEKQEPFNPSGAAAETPAATPTPQPMPPSRGRGEGMMGPMRGSEMGRRPSGNPGGTESSPSSYEEDSADAVVPPVPVEIQGIIYIYNPPAPPNPNGDAAAAAGVPAVPATPAGGPTPAAAPAPSVPPVAGPR
jgi:hypothetical protein